MGPTTAGQLLAWAAAAVVVQGRWLNPSATAQRTIERFAFASCNKVEKPSFFWPAISAREPQLFLWLGDNIYADKKSAWPFGGWIAGNASRVRHQLQLQRANPDYSRFAAEVDITGIYDDHDYAVNDAGREVEAEERRRVQDALLDFLDEPPATARRSRDGVWAEYLFGSSPRRVRLLLLDNRSHRDPYDDADGHQDMLGAEQWAWLEERLRATQAEVTFIGAGLQIVSRGDPHLAESWSRMPQSQAKLVALLAATNTSGAVFLSGDMHISETHRVTCGALGYPLYDFTASGLTHSWGGPLIGRVWRALMMGSTRVPGTLYQEKHWGEVEIHWPSGEGQQRHQSPGITYRVLSADRETLGRVVVEVLVPVGALTPAHGAGLARLKALSGADTDTLPGASEAATAVRSGDETARGLVSGSWQRHEPSSQTQVDAATALYLGSEAGAASSGATWWPHYPLLVNGEAYPRAVAQALAAEMSLQEAVSLCARDALSAGFSPACARVMHTCDPKISLRDSAYYFAGHAAVLGLIWGVVGACVVLAVAAVTRGSRWRGGRAVWLPVGAVAVAVAVNIIKLWV